MCSLAALRSFHTLARLELCGDLSWCLILSPGNSISSVLAIRAETTCALTSNSVQLISNGTPVLGSALEQGRSSVKGGASLMIIECLSTYKVYTMMGTDLGYCMLHKYEASLSADLELLRLHSGTSQ